MTDSFTLRDEGSPTAKPSALRDDTRAAALRGDDFATTVLDPLSNTATLAVTALDYSSTLVTWTLPESFIDIYGGTEIEWSAMMVMRSTTGYSLTVQDGVLVYSNSDRDAIPVQLVDTGLTPGRWYYYTLFLRLPGALPMHQAVAQADVLVPQDWGNRIAMWERVPEWYRLQDMRIDPSGRGGPLSRYVNVLGFTADQWRTYAESLLWARKADQMGLRMLPPFGASFGAPYEPNIGDGNYRTYAGNLVHLRRIKGTMDGVRQMISSISHYRADIADGLNLLPSPHDDGRSAAVGVWGSVVNLSAGKSPTGSTPVYAADGTLSGYTIDPTCQHVYGHSNAAVTPGTLTMPEGVYEGVKDWDAVDPAGRWHGVAKRQIIASTVQFFLPAINVNYVTGSVTGIPIKPSTLYTFRIYTHGLAQTGRQFRIGMWYRDQHGLAIGSDFTWMTTTSVGTFTRHTFATTSAANACSVVLALEWINMGVDEEQVFLFPMLFEGTGAPPFESSQAIKVCIRPQRINFAKNPDFDNGTSQWTVVNGSVSGGIFQAVPGSIITMLDPAPVDPEGVYAFSADFTGSGTWTLGATWYSLVGSQFVSTTQVVVDNAPIQPGRLSAKGIVPPTDAHLVRFVVRFDGTATMDRVLIDPTESTSYFDGDEASGERNDFRYDIPGDRNTYSYYSFNYKALQQRIQSLMVEYVPLGTPVLYDWDCLGPAAQVVAARLTMYDVQTLYATMNAIQSANPMMDDIPIPDV